MQNHWRLRYCVGSETLAGHLCRQRVTSRAVASRIANGLGTRQLDLVDAGIVRTNDAERSTFSAWPKRQVFSEAEGLRARVVLAVEVSDPRLGRVRVNYIGTFVVMTRVAWNLECRIVKRLGAGAAILVDIGVPPGWDERGRPIKAGLVLASIDEDDLAGDLIIPDRSQHRESPIGRKPVRIGAHLEVGGGFATQEQPLDIAIDDSLQSRTGGAVGNVAGQRRLVASGNITRPTHCAATGVAVLEFERPTGLADILTKFDAVAVDLYGHRHGTAVTIRIRDGPKHCTRLVAETRYRIVAG